MGKEGGRLKGRTKHKKTGAKSVQKFNSKRRLSRFGKERKKGESGLASAFVSRTQILKRLQITLKDFRRLCILKGIYPREPRRHLKGGKEKTYYHFKDVSHLSHEPLINKFREFKAFMKKVRKSLGRRETAKAKSLYQEAPTYTLHHIVKERYPKFEDALRDLDDALNLIHMFAALPATGRLTNDRTAVCRDLVAQWQFYITKARSLGKCFVSVKGVYFQAVIQGVPITWINPHEYTQNMPSDVDYRTMLTFLEFYETLLKFSLFKLYHLMGLRYPPVNGEADFEKTGRLMAMKVAALEEANAAEEEDSDKEQDSEDKTPKAKDESKKEAAKRVKQVRKELASMKNDEDDEEDDEEEEEDDERLSSTLSRAEVNRQIEAALVSATDSSASTNAFGGISAATKNGETGEEETVPLFDGLVFFLSRESQYSWLEFAILAHGGNVGWHGSSMAEADESITHVVYDRPVAPQMKRSDVEYVQPQWLLDSINTQLLLPLERYRPGVSLPPHLSPFVDDEKEGYTPAYRTELDSLKSAAEEYGNLKAIGEVSENNEDEEKVEEEEENEEEEDDDEEEDDEKEEEDDEEEEEEENEEEEDKKKVIPEEKQLALSMMSNKAKHLYDRMQHGINKKSGKVETLKKKRALAEALNTFEPEAKVDKSKKSKKSKK